MKEIKFVLSHLATIIWTASWFLSFILPTANGRITFGIIVLFSTLGLVAVGAKYLTEHWDDNKEQKMRQNEKSSSHPQWLVKYNNKIEFINTKKGVEIYLRGATSPETAEIFNISVLGTYKAKRFNAPISLIKDP